MDTKAKEARFILFAKSDALRVSRTNINNAGSGAWGHAPGLPHLLRTQIKAKGD
jgi:hypothetical protein